MAEKQKSSELQFIKELVDELYNYRDCYFETHGVEEAPRKQEDVARELEKVLKKLQEKEECNRHKAEFLLQKGRCLNVAPDFSAAAEDCLSRAVKLEPGLVQGWNTLGEQYWKKGDLMAAKNCFTGALQQSKNKVSLRNMSMVLRQLPAAGGDAHGKQVLESVDMARQAVQLDVTDGTSWYILGNAYVSLFFSCGQKPQLSTQALSAYAQAERVDRAAACYPELHFNRATLFQYEEMFGSALGGYSRAAALDPGWPEPAEKEKQLMEYLNNVTELCQKKSVFAGEGEGPAFAQHALRPDRVVFGPVFLSRLLLVDGPRGRPGAAAVELAGARPQRRSGRPGEGGVQPGVPGPHGLYVRHGGRRGDVRGGDGVQHGRQLGRPHRRHRGRSGASGQMSQYRTQRHVV
ncbi:tetratricopeptide repeat protein 5 isoform X3 [Phycodurus eques]|uniref:tetratricopeptide repeat protein 5 isoform X3 n=1 Tax=Phycodurus eques TaxID=693459 RepID=UPI002ACDC4F1|nr:tetratricopeptide repeat protein 5 isoform X3 [Phycodurus eques]